MTRCSCSPLHYSARHWFRPRCQSAGTPTVGEVFGLRSLGSIPGLTRTAAISQVVDGPVIAGVTIDETGKYDLALLKTKFFLSNTRISVLWVIPLRSSVIAWNERTTLESQSEILLILVFVLYVLFWGTARHLTATKGGIIA